MREKGSLLKQRFLTQPNTIGKIYVEGMSQLPFLIHIEERNPDYSTVVEEDTYICILYTDVIKEPFWRDHPTLLDYSFCFVCKHNNTIHTLLGSPCKCKQIKRLRLFSTIVLSLR